MNTNLTCSQVMALINFYIEGKLNPKLKKYVDLHLQNCHSCRQKVEELKQVYIQYDILKHNNTLNDTQVENKNDRELIKNLSAYIDNELSSDDNIKIRKITISNPNARKRLESMYKFQKLLHCAYNRTKNNIKTDYSKNIMSYIRDTSEEYSTDYFKKIAVIFIFIVFCILACFFYLYL